MGQMQIKDVDYVLALEQYRSFSMAAAALYISQPALSRYISNLEKSLDVQLFERSGKQVSLTLAGKRYIEIAREIRHKADELSGEMRLLSKARQQTLSIGMALRIGWHKHFSDTINTFRALQSEVDLQITEAMVGHLEEGVRNGSFELAFVSEPPAPLKFDFHKLYETHILLVTTGDHPCIPYGEEREGLPYPWIDLHRLADTSFVLQNHTCRIRTHIDTLFRQEGFSPHVAVNAQNTLSALHFAQAGVGPIFIRESDAKSITYPNLRFFFVGDPVFKVNIGFISRQNAVLSPPAEEFLRLYHMQLISEL